MARELWRAAESLWAPLQKKNEDQDENFKNALAVLEFERESENAVGRREHERLMREAQDAQFGELKRHNRALESARRLDAMLRPRKIAKEIGKQPETGPMTPAEWDLYRASYKALHGEYPPDSMRSLDRQTVRPIIYSGAQKLASNPRGVGSQGMSADEKAYLEQLRSYLRQQEIDFRMRSGMYAEGAGPKGTAMQREATAGSYATTTPDGGIGLYHAPRPRPPDTIMPLPRPVSPPIVDGFSEDDFDDELFPSLGQ